MPNEQFHPYTITAPEFTKITSNFKYNNCKDMYHTFHFYTSFKSLSMELHLQEQLLLRLKTVWKKEKKNKFLWNLEMQMQTF